MGFSLHLHPTSEICLAYQLSLAQLEERKTVTVQRAIVILRPAVRSREGRHFFCLFESYLYVLLEWQDADWDFTDIEIFGFLVEGLRDFSFWGANGRGADVI